MAKAIASDTASQAATMRGADLVCVALERCGVDVIFGYPGGASLPIYDDQPGNKPQARRDLTCLQPAGSLPSR